MSCCCLRLAYNLLDRFGSIISTIADIASPFYPLISSGGRLQQIDLRWNGAYFVKAVNTTVISWGLRTQRRYRRKARSETGLEKSGTEFP